MTDDRQSSAEAMEVAEKLFDGKQAHALIVAMAVLLDAFAERRIEQAMERLLSDEVIEVAAKAHCDHHVGKTNSVWDSGLTDKEHHREEMRAALKSIVEMLSNG